MKHLLSLFSGLLFGTGLILTGMYSPDIVLAGLKIGAETFRVDLYVTFGTALVTTFLIFQLKRVIEKPIANACYQLPTKEQIDWQLIAGAILFGFGWGLTGVCPGPNIVGLGIISWPFYWINFAGMIIGFLLVRRFIVKPDICHI